ncbi:MAG: FeoA family protein [Thermacetogeniaceae bacterium]
MAKGSDEKKKDLESNQTLRLDQLEAGECCRIVAFDTGGDWDKARKLLALGIYPGLQARLLQKFPTLVIQVGHAQFAIDRETGRQIEVVKEAGEAGRRRHRHRHRFCRWRSLFERRFF